MTKMINVSEKEFNNLIPDWAKNINDFLIDKKSFKMVVKPLFYNGYSIDKEIFMATFKCVNVTKLNPSKRYIKKLFDDILIKPIQKFCNENNVTMSYKIFPFHDYLWGEDMGYCNGGIAGEKWQETVDCLTDRFTNLKREGI